MSDVLITVPAPVTHSEVTLTKPTGEPLLDDNGDAKRWEFQHALWLEMVLGAPWWTACDANTATARVECAIRVGEAFEGKKTGEKVILRGADRDMLVDAIKAFRLPDRLGVFASKVRRFELAWLAAPTAPAEASPTS